MKKIFAPIIVLTGLALGGCNASSAPPPTVAPSPSYTKPACQTDLQEFRAKTAYQVFAVGARYSFYQFGRAAEEASLINLKTRYGTQLVNAFILQTQDWPLHVTVTLPGVTFTGVGFNIDCSQVTLHTLESWSVEGDETANKGQVFFSENAVAHDISMIKSPGVLTERWEVSSINGFKP